MELTHDQIDGMSDQELKAEIERRQALGEPCASREEALAWLYQLCEKRAETAQRQLDGTKAFRDSPAGRLLRENPGMTTGEAMRRLGYWKKDAWMPDIDIVWNRAPVYDNCPGCGGLDGRGFDADDSDEDYLPVGPWLRLRSTGHAVCVPCARKVAPELVALVSDFRRRLGHGDVRWRYWWCEVCDERPIAPETLRGWIEELNKGDDDEFPRLLSAAVLEARDE